MLIPHALARASSRAPLSMLALCALGAMLTTAACGKSESDGGSAGSGGAIDPNGGAAGHTARAGAAGAHSPPTEGGAAGDEGEAGEGGASATDSGGASADAGAAGAASAATCDPGGTLFDAGNYRDAAGNALWLRKTQTSITLARVPSGAATPSKRPTLWLVDRACAQGDALILRDASSSVRLDFVAKGSALSVCFSAAVATPDAAYALPPADRAHAADTGCAGKPFLALTAEIQ